MKILILVIIIISILIKIKKDKIHIEFKSFTQKGFKKTDDMYGIYCWDGKQGSGKSYSVAQYIENIRGNKIIITNQYGYYLKHKNYAIYESNIYDIIDKFNNHTYSTNYIIFFDELFSMVKKGELPQEIVTFISQLRKRHLIFLTTVQEWLDTNVSFRRYVKFSVSCNMFNFLNLFAVSYNIVQSGYDMKWDKDENTYVAPVLWTSIRKCNKKIADSYDTDEVIQISKKKVVSKIKSENVTERKDIKK